jgi:hypothetical protein
MKLQALLRAIDYSGMSDSELDTAYSNAMARGDSQSAAGAGVEINDRLATATGFVQSLYSQPFPKFTAIQASGVTTAGFVSADVANQAVQTNAARVGATIEKYATGGGIILIAVLGIATYFALSRMLR